MKKIIVLLILIGLSLSMYAQDKIVKISGEEIKCKVTSVGDINIFYKPFINYKIKPSIEKITKDKVFMIIYEDGVSLVMSHIIESDNTNMIDTKLDSTIFVAHASGLSARFSHFRGLGKQDNNNFNSLTTVFEVFIGKSTSLGIGGGITFHDDFNTYPIILELRQYFSKYSRTPYIYSDGGVVINPSKDKLNTFAELGLGDEFKMGAYTYMFISAGCYVEHHLQEYFYFKSDEIALAVVLKCGFKF